MPQLWMKTQKVEVKWEKKFLNLVVLSDTYKIMSQNMSRERYKIPLTPADERPQSLFSSINTYDDNKVWKKSWQKIFAIKTCVEWRRSENISVPISNKEVIGFNITSNSTERHLWWN